MVKTLPLRGPLANERVIFQTRSKDLLDCCSKRKAPAVNEAKCHLAEPRQATYYVRWVDAPE